MFELKASLHNTEHDRTISKSLLSFVSPLIIEYRNFYLLENPGLLSALVFQFICTLTFFFSVNLGNFQRKFYTFALINGCFFRKSVTGFLVKTCKNLVNH